MQDFNNVKALADLQAYAEEKLQHVSGGLVCPACGSGTGPKHTPAFSIRGNKWKCWACQQSGDIFDLAGLVEKTDDKKDQLRIVSEWVGVSEIQPEQAALPKNQAMVKNYLDETRRHIFHEEAVAYLSTRGMTSEEAKQLGFGYDPASKRLVIPWKGSSHYWIARDVTDTSNRKYEKPKSSEAGSQPLWNPEALTREAFFVVEGPFDAIAVERLGFESVSLGGVGAGPLISEMSKESSRACAILMLDADKAGQDAQARIKASMEQAGMLCIEYPGERFAKDADEMWRSDPERLREQLERAQGAALEFRSMARQENASKLYRSLRVSSPASLAKGLLELSGSQRYVPTGIYGLDDMLDGGLRPGLTVLAAASSLGKTTLAVQMADHICRLGRDVLFVTLEQSARDLVVKSISRGCYEDTAGEECIAIHEMLDPAARTSWTPRRKAVLEGVVASYEQVVAPHLEVLEGIGRTSVADIASYAQQMAEEGRTPIVFVDYLQLLSNEGVQDERISMNRSVSDLRRLARDLDTPVVCISAVRRDSYLLPVTLDSMKESGAIEYGADVVLGLQTAGVDMGEGAGSDRRARREADRKARSGKAAEYRDVELVVLKQREGRVHGADQAIPLTFVPQASVFV